jgi:hypothetical protein
MAQTAQPAMTRESARAELEATRLAFHELLDSLSEADFKKKSGNASWTNGQLMWHMAWGLGYIPNLVKRSRSGKDLKLPRGLFNLLNPWITRWGSRGITPAKVAKAYDDANARALATLDTIQDDDWTKGATITGNFETVADHFRIPAEHFAEHKADILKSLGRAE